MNQPAAMKTRPPGRMNHLQELLGLGQSVWYDNIRRGMLESGELSALRDAGVRGVTSNPSIFEKAIGGSPDYDAALAGLAEQDGTPSAVMETLMVEDIRRAASLFQPVYKESAGRDGYVSLEVGPRVAHGLEATVAEARRLWKLVDRPNVMIKVPGTAEGVVAVEQLITDGININVTLLFSVENYAQVAEAYLRGLEARVKRRLAVDRIASVASFFVSRVDTAIDAWIDERVRESGGNGAAGPDRPAAGLEALRGKAGVANARVAYRRFKTIFAGPRWKALTARGARAQRVLWASTGTKNPQYRDVLYVEELIGPETVNTVPPATLQAFLEHGRVRPSLEEGVDEAIGDLARLAAAGLDLEGVHRKLQEDGVAAFVKAHETLLQCVASKCEAVRGRGQKPAFQMGRQEGAFQERLARWKKDKVVERIWSRDAALWSKDPQAQKEIRERLGWLDVPEKMAGHAAELDRFARDAARDGLKKALLLGMGGSSLCPEVSRATFGVARSGGLALTVLDSTDPAAVRRAEAEHPAKDTLFVVSTKSGTTGETTSLESYFWSKSQAALGMEAAAHFTAITDPGTPLAGRAAERRYRRTFINPPDIGGRYSALSYFGLAPAALQGLDVAAVLARAAQLIRACRPGVPEADNPGLALGAALSVCAAAGRDKVTFLCAPSIRTFGVWVEQLIAESTGKIGKGLIPVADEPVGTPEVYGGDRVFAVLRDGAAPDPRLETTAERLAGAGHPVLMFTLRDPADLWGEFFRWEFAVAAAGAALGINPFDQLDVESAKVRTRAVLERLSSGGGLPPPPADRDQAVNRVREEMGRLKPGEYVAVLSYLPRTPVAGERLMDLRRALRERTRAAVTLGEGPRYLHSTGQLHKGGPNTGVFLLLTAEPGEDLAIPGQRYTFGQLFLAQAVGDKETLEAAGRRVVRVHLGADPDGGLAELARALAR